MTNKTQTNRLEKQLRLYKKYLKFCRIEYVGELCIEIAKLEYRMEVLRQMTDPEIIKKVTYQYIIIQSKANKITL